MRIAQVSPLYESVPPKLYGGTERIVHGLTEALVGMGHDVTLFASGDSRTSARLHRIGQQSLRLSGCHEALAPHVLMFELLKKEAASFDIIHFHTEYMHFNQVRSLGVPSISTMHGRLDRPEYRDLFLEFCDVPLVSISASQRKPLSFANWVGTVHHGIDARGLSFVPHRGSYLAFLGRISPEKGVHHAIEIARRTGLALKIAAKYEPQNDEYYKAMEPLLHEPFVEFVGEINDREKPEFLGGAAALLFPIQWPEPFGLVMIEAMAVGTPVIAFRNGSVSEVIREGVSGAIVESVDEACEAVRGLDRFDRKRCREEFERRFTVDRMARDYIAIYEEIGRQSAVCVRRLVKRRRAPSLNAETTGGMV